MDQAPKGTMIKVPDAVVDAVVFNTGNGEQDIQNDGLIFENVKIPEDGRYDVWIQMGVGEASGGNTENLLWRVDR